MKNLSSNIKQFFGLSYKEKWLFIKALLILSIATLLIKTLPFKQLKGLFEFVVPTRETGIKELEIKQIKRLGNIFPNLFSCLPQALTAMYLEGKSENVNLHFGVQNDGIFEAHAWVEKNGKVLIGERKMDHFKKLWQW